MKNNYWWLRNDAYSRKAFLSYYFRFLKSGDYVFNYDYAILKGPKDSWVSKNDLLKTHEGLVLKKLENLDFNGVCIDVGAFIGHLSILLAQKCSKVYAIEPDKRNIKYLKNNLKKNNISNVEIFPIVISEHDGWSKLVMAPNSSGNSICANGFYLNKKSLSMNSLLKKINKKISLVKMDIQGAEYDILKTASEDIFEKIDQWIIECHSQEKFENEKLANILKKHNYQVEWLGLNGINSEVPHLYAKKF